MTSDRLPPDQDAALERTLRDFFAREMPAELHALPDAPAAVNGHARPAASATRPRRKATVALLAAVGLAACALVAAVVTSRPGVPPEGPSRPIANERPAAPHIADDAREPVAEPSAGSLPPAVAAWPADELDEGPLFVVESVEPLERRTIATPRGPVEQRTDLRWTNVRFVEQETGTQIDYAVPNEITIEILPLDGGEAAPRLTPQAPPDTRLPEERAREP